MSSLAEFAARQSIPTLAVRIGGGEQQVHVIEHGMTIGRAPSNGIVVDCCDVCAEHALIQIEDDQVEVTCVQSEFWLSLPSGTVVRRMPLVHGAEFLIGEARFRFESVPVRIHVGVTRPAATASACAASTRAQPVMPFLPPIRAACPRCHDELARIPTSAKFCPRCGLELPEHCPPWFPAIAVDLSNPALLAYANALFNLGIRFENDGEILDLEQARRYYEKAARIGLTHAKARLEEHWPLRQNEPSA